MESINPTSGESSEGESPSDSDLEKLREAVKRFRAELVETAPKYATQFYEQALDTERAFDKRRQSIKSEEGGMSQKEFEKWEDALADDIGYAERELTKTDGSLEIQAECEQAMIFSRTDTELHRTIEAQAGRFFHTRMTALREAIQSSGGDSAQRDLEYASGFYGSVMSHLDFKYMTAEEVKSYGYEAYERGRTYAHNAAIRHLNGINELARKYKVRPFTVRDFWPSDLRDMSRQTPAVAKVMRYDRDLVEEYYAIAFSSDVKKRKAKQDRESRYGLY